MVRPGAPSRPPMPRIDWRLSAPLFGILRPEHGRVGIPDGWAASGSSLAPLRLAGPRLRHTVRSPATLLLEIDRQGSQQYPRCITRLRCRHPQSLPGAVIHPHDQEAKVRAPRRPAPWGCCTQAVHAGPCACGRHSQQHLQAGSGGRAAPNPCCPCGALVAGRHASQPTHPPAPSRLRWQ